MDLSEPTNRSLNVTLNALKLRFESQGVKIEVFDPSIPENYKKLHELEKAANIGAEKTAAVETFIDGQFFPGQAFVEKELVYYIDAILNPKKGAIREKEPVIFETAKKTAIAVMGKVEDVDGEPAVESFSELTLYHYKMKKLGGAEPFTLAYIYVPINCPVCADAEFFAVVNKEMKVVEIVPIRDLEVNNQQVNAAPLFDSLKKFLNTVPPSIPKQNKDVDGISGATKTNNAYINYSRVLAAWLEQERKKKTGSEGTKDTK